MQCAFALNARVRPAKAVRPIKGWSSFLDLFFALQMTLRDLTDRGYRKA